MVPVWGPHFEKQVAIVEKIVKLKKNTQKFPVNLWTNRLACLDHIMF